MDPSTAFCITVPTTPQFGIGNILKGYITLLSLCDDVIISPNKNVVLGDYDQVFENTNTTPQIRDREYFFSWRFNVLKEEEGEQKHLHNEFSKDEVFGSNPKFCHLFSRNVTIDLFYDRSLICDRVFNRIMNGIDKIKWNHTILEEVRKYEPLIGNNALGVSVRTWKGKHEHNIYRYYSAPVYINAMQKVLENKDITTIFMSYDNTQAKGEYEDILKNYNVIEYIKPSHISELQYAIIKMLLLSKCTYFICNRISTYSELVFWFSRCNQKVTPLF